MILFIASMVLLLLVVLVLLLLPMWRTDKRMVTLLALVITISSGLLYAWLGSPRILPLAMERQTELRALYKQIEVTSAILAQNPNNLDALLTRSQAYSDAGNYALAADGFKQAVLLSKGHPRIIMAYAETLILQANGVVTEQAKKSIDIALMIDKKLPIGRYYKAVWLLQNDQQKDAMKMMKELYHELPEDSSLKRRINNDISR